MKEDPSQARTTSQTFYLTLSSITASLALGYLLTTVDSTRMIVRPSDAGFWLRVALLFQVIVLTWHEYALRTVYFQWQINYFDSVIPFAFAVVQYVAISGLRPSGDAWFWEGLAAFAYVSAIAYNNQRAKAGRDSVNKLMSRHHGGLFFTC